MKTKESKYAEETFAKLILDLDLMNPGEKLTEAYLSSYSRALNNKNPMIREKAAQALGMMGAKAKEAVPSLAWTLFDQEEGVATQSAIALGKIGEAASESIPYVIEALNSSPHNEAKLQMIQSLRKMGPLDVTQIAALFEVNKDTNKEIRISVKKFLTEIGIENQKDLDQAIQIIRENEKVK